MQTARGTAGDRPGVFVFSLDTELAWGSMHRGGYAGRERDFERTRYVVDELVSLFEQYEISATWAVVGHLFLDSCAPLNGVKHPEIKRPEYPWFQGDWFDRDPCGNVKQDPWWYAPDIVSKIQSCRVPQEIGSHNFSHIIVGEAGCTAECFDSELKASRRVAASRKLTLRSFVYPRNSIGHVDVLARNGFTSYRGIAPAWHAGLPGATRRLARLVDNFLPIRTPTVRPVKEGNIWNIPASYNYLHRSGWGRYVPIGVRVRKATATMRRAAREGSVFHLWTHPFNIASDPRGLLKGLNGIFQEFKSLRDSGLMVSRTMSQVVESMDGASSNETRQQIDARARLSA